MPDYEAPALPAAEHQPSVMKGSGAGDGNRTHDMQLGKLPFYH